MKKILNLLKPVEVCLRRREQACRKCNRPLSSHQSILDKYHWGGGEGRKGWQKSASEWVSVRIRDWREGGISNENKAIRTEGRRECERTEEGSKNGREEGRDDGRKGRVKKRREGRWVEKEKCAFSLPVFCGNILANTLTVEPTSVTFQTLKKSYVTRHLL